jgi:outer membrane protein OmpA-like peptidoglycan-associated protein
MFIKSFRRMIGMSALTLSASLTVVSSNANAQSGMAEKPTWPTHATLGFGGAADGNVPSSGQYVVDGVTYTHGPLFPNFEFHLLGEFPIATNLMFAPRIAYNDFSTRWDDGQGVVTPTTAPGAPDFKDLAVSFQTIGADLMFKYSFSNFHVMAGPHFSTPFKYSYSHSANITDATNSTTNILNPAKFIAAIKGGIGYDIPLNSKNTIWLTPEAFYDYFVTDFSQKQPDLKQLNGGEYFITTIQAGLSLKFNVGGDDVPPPMPMSALEASITARGVLPDNSAAPEPIVPQQGMHTRASMPLLPYVFFANNDPSIPARYSRMGSTGFTTESLSGKNETDANHALLDIVGQRLKQYSTAAITITGTNENAGQEKNNINLSKARAMAVRDYLVNTWGIDASRITVDQRNLPELPTNPTTGAGKEENRRAEIVSADSRITAPVINESRSSNTVGETVVRFETSVRPTDVQWKDWSISLDDNGTPIGTALTGTGMPPATTTTVIANAGNYLNKPVHYKLVTTTMDGRQAVADGMTRVVPRTVDRENLEKYAMLSFDFNTADINARARQMLDLISESISRDATGINVTGYCDSTGTPEYNQALSEQRANSAITALRASTKLPANTAVHGVGLRDPKFANELPEGRQLNRRVEVSIEKSSK